MSPVAGPVALVGSGEYLPVLEDLERALIAGRPSRYVQLATAAAPEGRASLQRWHDLGADAARRLGVQQVVVDVVDRQSADDPAHAALIEGAGLVYLSGGNPAYLAESLRGSAVWRAVVAAWRGGAALAGCSAGAMALSGSLPDIRHPWRPALEGLGLVPTVEVLPHFDAFLGRLPDLVVRRVAGAPPGVRVLGIDEDTAVVGGLPCDEPDDTPWAQDPAGPGTRWRVLGRSSAWSLNAAGTLEHPSGSSLRL